MRVLKTTVNKTSEDFRRAQAQYESLIADLKKHLAIVQAGGPADAVALHKKRGKMTARERIAALLADLPASAPCRDDSVSLRPTMRRSKGEPTSP